MPLLPFHGYCDGNPKTEAREKLARAIAGFVGKHGRLPLFCLTGVEDAEALAVPTRKHPGELPVQVLPRSYVSRGTFYVGDEEMKA